MWPPVSHPLVHPYQAPAPAPPAPAEAPAQGQAPAPVEAPPAPAAQPHAQGQGNANLPPGVVWVVMRDRQGAPGTRLGLALRLAQAFLAAAALAAMASTDGFASVTAFRYLVPAAALQCLWSLALAVVDVYALLLPKPHGLMAATAMAFLSWFALAPCCVLNLGMCVYKLQRP